jgi:L-methionine (R)-S-oxide reductase
MSSRNTPISPDWPHWYQPEAPLGSAVRYVAGLSSKFDWVGIYVLKGQMLELGPYIGAATDHKRIPVGRGVCGTAVAENQDQNIPDVRGHSNYLACSLDTRSELVVLVRDKKGAILGQIDIDSHTTAAFGPDEVSSVRKVADELGGLWPA